MQVSERFLKYISFETTSNEESATFPSSKGQLVLAKALANELKTIGAKSVRCDKYGYVYATIPSNIKTSDAIPTIGFISHMDTSDAASGKNVKACVIEYKGGDIRLSDKCVTDVKSFPKLKLYKGQHLIITDGSTLLGADDKAGIAEIMSAAEFLLTHSEIKHGKIAIAFTPDEEIGCGTDHFDIKEFGADYAYTVDGGTLGEIEYESFNAASAKIVFHGVNVHPGYAKGIMKNSVLMARDFMDNLPQAEDPAHTEGYEGYYHVQSVNGNETETALSMIIRDHDTKAFKSRKKLISDLCDFLNHKYGAGSVELLIEDSYYNMKEVLKHHMHVVEKAKLAMKACGVTPEVVPIRGGTDGCRLSFDGLPCPNLSTGGEYFHGVNEFISVESMNKMVEVLVEISKK